MRSKTEVFEKEVEEYIGTFIGDNSRLFKNEETPESCEVQEEELYYYGFQSISYIIKKKHQKIDQVNK